LDQVKEQVWNHVREQVLDQVKEQVWNHVREQVKDQVWYNLYVFRRDK
jgi:hypothetical protein